MKITEVTSNLRCWAATVKAGGVYARTEIKAENISYARSLLAAMYGGNQNVMTVNEVSLNEADKVPETATIKPLSPEKAVVKSLANQAAQLTTRKKMIQAQQGLKRAQSAVAKAAKPPTQR